jgi:hypothetical protein
MYQCNMITSYWILREKASKDWSRNVLENEPVLLSVSPGEKSSPWLQSQALGRRTHAQSDESVPTIAKCQGERKQEGASFGILRYNSNTIACTILFNTQPTGACKHEPSRIRSHRRNALPARQAQRSPLRRGQIYRAHGVGCGIFPNNIAQKQASGTKNYRAK